MRPAGLYFSGTNPASDSYIYVNTSLKEELRKMFRNNHHGFTMRLLALMLAAVLIAGSALAADASSALANIKNLPSRQKT